jgi:hypothetical protein
MPFYEVKLKSEGRVLGKSLQEYLFYRGDIEIKENLDDTLSLFGKFAQSDLIELVTNLGNSELVSISGYK